MNKILPLPGCYRYWRYIPGVTGIAPLMMLLILLIGGCGYRFAGGGGMPADVKRISIEIFDNRTGETGIESIITNDVINEFSRNTIVDVTRSKDAEAVLTGIIRSAKTRALSHYSAYSTSEREITIVVDLKLTTPDGEVLWSAKRMEASESYPVSSEKIRTEQNKKSAVANLSVRLAQRIFYRITDRF